MKLNNDYCEGRGTYFNTESGAKASHAVWQNGNT